MTKGVFISSTSKDLPEYRAAVDKAIRRLGLRPINMDDFGSQPGGAAGVSLREVQKADIFVGIVARRYGYVPDGGAISVTEQEYDQAERRGIPRLMYLLDPNVDWPPELIEADDRAQTRLAAFRARIERQDVRSLFATPDGLAAQLTADLTKFMQRERRSRVVLRVGGALLLLALTFVILGLTNAGGLRSQVVRAIDLSGLGRLHGVPFAPEQVGVVFADFEQIDADAPNVPENLEREFKRANIPFTRVYYPLDNREEARAVSDLYNATIVIWGEVALGGVQVYFEVTPRHSYIESRVDELEVAAAELESFNSYIFTGMDSLYMVNFIQGQISYFEADAPAALVAFDTAVAELDSIAPDRALDMQGFALLLYRANTYYDLGQSSQAIADLDRALALKPDFFQAHINRGYIRYHLGEPAQAIADFDRALELNPDYANTYNSRGLAYLDQKRYPDALADFYRAIQLDPNFVEAYNNRGIVYKRLKQNEAALADYARALQLDPNRAATYHNQAFVLTDQGQYEAALASYTRAIELEPDFEDAYLGRGLTYYDLEQYDLALADTNQALRLAPDDTGALMNRALIYEGQGNHAASLADYESVVERDAGDAAAYLDRGLAHFYLGHDDAALADFDRALALDPANAEAYRNRAGVYDRRRDYDRAIADYDHLLDLKPDDAAALASRGLDYYGLEQYDAALADFNRAIELYPDEASSYANRGLVYFSQGDYERAFADADHALNLDPTLTSALIVRGFAAYSLGNYAQAASDYQAYEQLTGMLESFMEEQIADMALAPALPPP